MNITIQGQGAISAAGSTAAAAWQRYVLGEPCWEQNTETGHPVYRIDALPVNPQVNAFSAKNQPDRSALLALYAADEAVKQAGWEGKDFAILVGCSRGPTQSWEEGFSHFSETGASEVRTSPKTTLGSIGFALADYFSTEALASSLSVTCSSGMHAILHGIALLQSGMAERVLVGGAEAPLTTFTLRQLEALRIVAPVPEVSAHACRPMDQPASGMVIGEGAAFLALSLADPARDAGKPHLTALAHAREKHTSPTGISPTGEGLQKTMRAAIAQACWPDLIIAHAPGTKRGDAAELTAIQALCSDAGKTPFITSFKWATGHTFGASGPLAISAALGILEHRACPPIPYASDCFPTRTIERILINATGFGGNVVSLMVGR
ncbi:beta-ketoacyl synthase N-terminal-like domain-containing protein [Neolewinella persica]|uniref:beta-ketoacyl synthase N-terminal-like domain-containing protein n=1 Tax=Neolewinella persica TaxID=70998 RepID=UPI0003674AE4|nr:beta-ketoacyl synthase N-terminal-like domain-containing protein [Neolewinella persica]